MHELSLAAGMMETVGQNIPAAGVLQNVQVSVGALSGVSVDALRFCFEAVSRDAGHEQVSLIIREVAARFRCRACGLEYGGEDMYEPCPACRSFDRDVLDGMQFTLDAIEVEETSHV